MRNIIGLEYLDLCPEINHRSQFGSIMFPFLWDGVIEDSNYFFKGILFITHDLYVIFILDAQECLNSHQSDSSIFKSEENFKELITDVIFEALFRSQINQLTTRPTTC